MPTQIRHCSSAYVLEMLIVISKHVAQRTDTPNCDLTILHIRNGIPELLFLRQCLKRRKEDKTKLDLFVSTNLFCFCSFLHSSVCLHYLNSTIVKSQINRYVILLLKHDSSL